MFHSIKENLFYALIIILEACIGNMMLFLSINSLLNPPLK